MLIGKKQIRTFVILQKSKGRVNDLNGLFLDAIERKKVKKDNVNMHIKRLSKI